MASRPNDGANLYPDAKRPDTLPEGIEFQDFICKRLAERHIILQNLGSRRFQHEVGENLQGFEIKLDNRCTDTDRLSIEIAEKTKASNFNFVQSGIYRDDNSWLYMQGNYKILFIFAKNLLQGLHRSGRYAEKEEKTIRAFYLPFPDAKKYAALVINF